MKVQQSCAIKKVTSEMGRGKRNFAMTKQHLILTDFGLLNRSRSGQSLRLNAPFKRVGNEKAFSQGREPQMQIATLITSNLQPAMLLGAKVSSRKLQRKDLGNRSRASLDRMVKHMPLLTCPSLIPEKAEGAISPF